MIESDQTWNIPSHTWVTMDMTLVHMQLHNVCVCVICVCVCVCVRAAGCRPLTNWDAGPSERHGPRAGLNLTNS